MLGDNCSDSPTVNFCPTPLSEIRWALFYHHSALTGPKQVEGVVTVFIVQSSYIWVETNLMMLLVWIHCLPLHQSDENDFVFCTTISIYTCLLLFSSVGSYFFVTHYLPFLWRINISAGQNNFWKILYSLLFLNDYLSSLIYFQFNFNYLFVCHLYNIKQHVILPSQLSCSWIYIIRQSTVVFVPFDRLVVL